MPIALLESRSGMSFAHGRWSGIEIEDPQTLLTRVAKDWEADCIFVGARKLSRFGRFMIGSVSTAVIARAPCSVEVVRSPQAKRRS
jgi:nucleotide-binding universal stress UspA family protein